MYDEYKGSCYFLSVDNQRESGGSIRNQLVCAKDSRGASTARFKFQVDKPPRAVSDGNLEDLHFVSSGGYFDSSWRDRQVAIKHVA